jgi:hypothetical protein
MKEIRVKIHSIIDVITNSSTEIFQYVSEGAKDKAIELIDKILETAGSDKKAVDLFDISVGYSEDTIEDILSNYRDRFEEDADEEDGVYSKLLELFPDFKEKYLNASYPEYRIYKKETLVPALVSQQELVERIANKHYSDYSTDLVITPKVGNDVGKNLFEDIAKCFNAEEVSN